jgi:uncharacterized membrane protein
MKNKAEISVSMIIGIVIIVLTFGIIAIVYSQLITPVDMDREVCKQYAALRGTMPDGLATGQIKDLIALKCKTKRICVTSKTLLQGKGECEKELGSDYSTYRIKEKTAEQQIKTLLAREMADCWDMLGRGNLQIFAREITTDSPIESVGVICSRIHFDETITESNGLNIQQITGMNRYLLSHKVPNYEISYWDFLRNAYDGETMAILYGQGVQDNQVAKTLTFLEAPTDLTKTKAITYVEASPTAAGAIFGAMAGAGVGVIGSIFVPKMTGFFIGGGAYLGARVGEWAHLENLGKEKLFKSAEDSKQTSASAIFLTDYTMEGFQRFSENEKAGFQIASYA